MQLPDELLDETWVFADAESEKDWHEAEVQVAARMARREPLLRARVRDAIAQFLSTSPEAWDRGPLETLEERASVSWEAHEGRERLRQALAFVLNRLESLGD